MTNTKLSNRRQFLHLAAGATALQALPHIARAQAYPTRPVRIVVGFPPGGSNDIHARLIAQWLSDRLGQQFIVDNRPGAGGNIATESVVRAAPDGYTLLEASSADAWNSILYSKLKFNFTRDLAHVATISRGIGVVTVNPTFPPRSIPDLIAYAKANPGKATVASAGIGSAPHIYWELFRTMTGVDILHVPYRGGAQAITDMFAGQVQVMFNTLGTSIEYIRSGRLRALAITDTKRSQALPEVPPLSDFVPGYEASGWQGICAPKDTPAEIIEMLNKEINAGLGDPKIQARIADLGGTTFIASPAEFGKFIIEFTERWGKVIRSANIKVD
jgi:tripartite-type tricarboxylate transporter receptor subunit TctC